MKNLLIVIADTLRYDDGMEALSWLRARSVTYENAWAHGAATYPSFPSLWTGLEVHEHAAVHRRTRPKAPGLDQMLRELGYSVYATTENPYTAWAMQMHNAWAYLHGDTAEELPGRTWELSSPWAIIYHSMLCHWPYKFDPMEHDLPVGWPWEHPDIEPEAYHEAYRSGVAKLSEQLQQLMISMRPDVTILTSDHGEGFMEHGVYLHPPEGHYPEQLHVPLIVHDGNRRYTDKGLLGLKNLPAIVLAAAEGKRIRARDKYVRVEDYHADPAYSMVHNNHLIAFGQVYNLDLDPYCQDPIEGAEYSDNIVPPPLQEENAEVFLEPGDDDTILERLRALGYVE